MASDYDEELRELHKQIWKEEQRHSTRRGLPHNYTALVRARTLTKPELERVLFVWRDAVRRDLGYAFAMGNEEFGFSLAIDVYAPGQHIFPGADVPPSHLITVGANHLPWYKGYKESWQKAWELFSEFTHSEKNRKALREWGMPHPRDESYYDY